VIELAALKARPGIFMRIRRIDCPEKILRQSARLLEPRKGLEGSWV
jgi:hypothetical protein